MSENVAADLISLDLWVSFKFYNSGFWLICIDFTKEKNGIRSKVWSQLTMVFIIMFLFAL
jgi:hypothetical protein